MKHLIIVAHPNPDSFTMAMVHQTHQQLLAKGDSCQVRDLYAMGFDPVLSAEDLVGFKHDQIKDDIAQEQRYLLEADMISFFYPLWWGGAPAILRGYIDRVFSYGFAYQYGPKGMCPNLLEGKRAIMITPMGAPLGAMQASGMIEAMRMTMDVSICESCGLDLIEHRYLGSVVSTDDTIRARYLEELRELYAQL